MVAWQEMDEETLVSMKRRELQRWCKEFGFKANGKNVEMLKMLCEHLANHTDDSMMDKEAEAEAELAVNVASDLQKDEEEGFVTEEAVREGEPEPSIHASPEVQPVDDETLLTDAVVDESSLLVESLPEESESPLLVESDVDNDERNGAVENDRVDQDEVEKLVAEVKESKEAPEEQAAAEEELAEEPAFEDVDMADTSSEPLVSLQEDESSLATAMDTMMADLGDSEQRTSFASPAPEVTEIPLAATSVPIVDASESMDDSLEDFKVDMMETLVDQPAPDRTTGQPLTDMATTTTPDVPTSDATLAELTLDKPVAKTGNAPLATAAAPVTTGNAKQARLLAAAAFLKSQRDASAPKRPAKLLTKRKRPDFDKQHERLFASGKSLAETMADRTRQPMKRRKIDDSKTVMNKRASKPKSRSTGSITTKPRPEVRSGSTKLRKPSVTLAGAGNLPIATPSEIVARAAAATSASSKKPEKKRKKRVSLAERSMISAKNRAERYGLSTPMKEAAKSRFAVPQKTHHSTSSGGRARAPLTSVSNRRIV